MRLIRLAAGLAALSWASVATGASFADPATIDAAVARFTGASIGQPGGARLPADRRMKLAPCAMPLALEWYGRARESVLVRCPVAGGWRLYVPVADANSSSAAAAAGTSIVARGESVAISVRGRGFSLTRQGEALDTGAAGEWIRVRPAGNKMDPIRARILRPGVVVLELP
jgi:flagella basal body P-ring formation protein FlgA